MENSQEKFYLSLCDLPDIVLDKIFSFLSFDEIAKNRQVCQQFNTTGSRLLNKGLKQAERYQVKCVRKLKSQLPRRESERISHPLYRRYNILLDIGSQLSLISVHFMRFICFELCCFIPGKVIDECFRLLWYMENNPNDPPPDRSDPLQELKDLVAMALEHFQENIAPALKGRLDDSMYPSPLLFGRQALRSMGLEGSSGRSTTSNYQFLTSQKYEKDNPDEVKEVDEEFQAKKINMKLAKQSRMLKKQAAKFKALRKRMHYLEEKIEETDHKLDQLDCKINEAKVEPSLVAVSHCSQGKRKYNMISSNACPSEGISSTKNKRLSFVRNEDSD